MLSSYILQPSPQGKGDRVSGGKVSSLLALQRLEVAYADEVGCPLYV